MSEAIAITCHGVKAIRQFRILDEPMFLGEIGNLSILETGEPLSFGEKMAGDIEKCLERSAECCVGGQRVSPVGDELVDRPMGDSLEVGRGSVTTIWSRSPTTLRSTAPGVMRWRLQKYRSRPAVGKAEDRRRGA